MSTDRSKKKRRFPRVEWIRIVEYGLIALIVLAFVGLSIYYGLHGKSHEPEPEPEPEPAAPTQSPAPTEDTSPRGMNVWNALESAGYEIRYDESLIISPEGVQFTMRMHSRNDVVQTLSFETVLCPDSSEDAAFARILNEKNRQTVEALRDLFDCVLPVFGRTIADSDYVVTECQKVVESGQTASKRMNAYSVRIESDPNADLQTVIVTLERNVK